jgi:hypothetical protein
MSFSESLFSAGLFQKTTKRDLFIKGKFRIKIQHICEKTLEDMRRHRNETGSEGLPVGPADPTYRPPSPPWGDTSMSFWSILLLPPRMHLSRTSTRFDPRAHVGPPGLYKETVAPLEGIKSFRDQAIQSQKP